MKKDRVKAVLESLLYSAGTPIAARRLMEIVGISKNALKEGLNILRAEYSGPNRGIRLIEVAGGYQIRTIAEYAEYVKALGRDKPLKLSRAALETLAIIAYRQPLTKIEIEAVRGVDVDGVLNSLLTRKLINVLGRKDVPGRPWIYGTSTQFLEIFNLGSIKDLPPLPEIHEPTANPYAEQVTGIEITKDIESGGGFIEAQGGNPDSKGPRTGEWANGHETRHDR